MFKWDPEINRIRCTKFNEGCTKFSAPKHFLMGFEIKLWTIHVQMGVAEVIGSDVPNLMKNVPNLVNDVPRVPKRVSRWGSTPNNFLMGF